MPTVQQKFEYRISRWWARREERAFAHPTGLRQDEGSVVMSGIPFVSQDQGLLREIAELAMKYQFALNPSHFRGDDCLVHRDERRADVAADLTREDAQPFQVHGARTMHDRGRLRADEPGAIGMLVARRTGFLHPRE
jgi:hypothetical protein